METAPNGLQPPFPHARTHRAHRNLRRRACRTGGRGRAPAGGQGPSRLQQLGGHRDHGGLRAALHAPALSQMVRMAGGQHRVWCGVVPDPRSRGRHAAGAVRLHQRLLGHRGHGAHHLSGGAAHQRVCGALWGGHGPAHARRGFWLHRLHGHLADLRQLYVHLLCAGGRRDGLCAGAGARHSAHLGLPDLCRRGDSAGYAWRVGHQPPAGVDATAVAGDAGGAVCVCAAARSWCVLWRGALRW